MIKKTLFFTILYNRPQMLKLAALNLLTHAQNGRYVLWDNGDDSEVEKICQKLINENPTVEVIYHKSKTNIGLNAAKKVIDSYLDDHEFIMSLDEDILFLPMGFQGILQSILSQTEKPIGYVACNVFQDGLTNGAKPPASNYRSDKVFGHKVLYGPTGGWASMTRTDIYNQVGGYPEHKELFYGLDGEYTQKLNKAGIYNCLAEDVICYHATGKIWNDYFNYQTIFQNKIEAYNKSKGAK